ncbi:hypothetical protein WJX73_005030 [Symbiochloris irregularis]|uniref:Amine oxidase n=1 Tax=Symbiochloris irregularis TaxID=706552 RepID=A0AAW1PZJ3_9CHLO
MGAAKTPCRPSHPLDGLQPTEIVKASEVCRREATDRKYPRVRFCSITLQEPSRAALASWESGGKRPARQAFVILTVGGTSTPNEVLVDLSGEGSALSWQKVGGVTVSLVPDDFKENQFHVKADPEVQKLVASLGIPMYEIEVATWPVHAAERDLIPRDRMLVQGFLYWCPLRTSNLYAHPLPWTATLDVDTQKVIRIESAWEGRDLPALCSSPSDYSSDLFKGSYRTDIKPINIEQPEGPSFVVEGSSIQWQKWSMRVGFNYREGMVLHDVGFAHGHVGDPSRVRPILHRASMPEMVVPYAEQQAPFHRRQAFDAGDCGFGFAVNSLELGCDCVGHIHYFDTVLNNSKGEPEIKRKVVCLHEEDAGMLWKHTELRSGHVEQRRGRRLVLSSICTLGNYEYGFYWYFYQDGSIQYEVKLTGILSTNITSPEDGDDPVWGTLMLPGVTAGWHQHLFIARLDWALDSSRSENAPLQVSEVDVQLVKDARNRFGSAFEKVVTELGTQGQAQRMVDPLKARTWSICNPGVKHPVTGKPVAYKLVPGASQTLLAMPDSTTFTRAEFATKSLWVTQADDSHIWPGGDYPLQNTNPGGLAEWAKEDREITHPVTWHVFGATHIPRPEDFPIMPVETTGFWLKPVGFFANNPTLDIPPFTNATSKLHTCCPSINPLPNGDSSNGNGHANGHYPSSNGHHEGNGHLPPPRTTARRYDSASSEP